MNKSESKRCFNEQIRKRWPRWEAAEIEIADWLEWLRRYDYAAIARAARAHAAESRYAKPIAAALLDHARRLAAEQKTPAAAKSASVPPTHTFIQCVAHARQPQRVGWFVDILLTPLHRQHPPEAWRRAAAETARRCADFYGGVWQVVTDTDQLAMMRRRQELKRLTIDD